ncbi:hypothetical protein IAT38_000962 [Cryptococcus sp. DSM 104549]
MVVVRTAIRTAPLAATGRLASRRYASTVTPPPGPTPGATPPPRATPPSNSNNGWIWGGGAVGLVGLYFWYVNSNKSDAQKLESQAKGQYAELKGKAKGEYEELKGKAEKALK